MAEAPTTTRELEGFVLPDMGSFDELLATLREGYTNAINDVLDACLAHLILPKQQEAVAIDAAQFLTFILAVKIVTNNREPLDRKHLLQAFRRINKAVEKEVPAMLLSFAGEVQSKGSPAAGGDEELDAMLDTIRVVEPANDGPAA